MKSHVSMEQKLCIVCGKAYDSGAILLDTRVHNGKLMESMERHTATGFGICKEHQKLSDKGYVHLLGCDESKSNISKEGKILPQNAYRTGQILHIRKKAFVKMFNIPKKQVTPIMFVDQKVMTLLKKKVKNQTK